MYREETIKNEDKKIDTLIGWFIKIHWFTQLITIVAIAVVGGIFFALGFALVLYEPLTGREVTEGFVLVIAITTVLTGVVVALPIVSMLLAFSRMLHAKEKRAIEAIKISERKNNIFASLLEGSVTMQRSDKLLGLVDDVIQRLEKLIPESPLGIIVDSTRPSVVVSFSSKGITDEEKQLLLDSNEVLLGDVEIGCWGEKKYHRYEGWFVFPMNGHGQGQGVKAIGKLMIKGEELTQENKEVIELFLEQLTATTENKLLSLELEKSANTDYLTGLFSRNYFQVILERQLLLKKESDMVDFSIIVIDINGLKKVNDTVGHIAGDAFVVSAAKLLKTIQRKEDWVCRVGGDEFVIICPCTKLDEVNVLVDRITSASKDLEIDVLDRNSRPIKIPMSMSIGVATSAEVDPGTVYGLADERMYVNKRRYYKEKGLQETKETSSSH